MGQWKHVPFVGSAYTDDDKPWSVQDTVNYILVTAEEQGTRSSSMLRCAPGWNAPFATCVRGGENPQPPAPIRGAHNAEGLFLVVAGQTLFQINPDGSTLVLGKIPGVGRVSMAHNQITGGNQIAIANGSSGYVYDTVAGTLTQITDDGFPGAIAFEYLDSYILGIEPQGRFGFTSGLADALSYNTLDRVEAEGAPDRIVGQLVTHREWWLFGQRTIEPFQDTGANTGTFQRAYGVVMEVGLASAFALAELDNAAFWLGQDGVVYRANGYTPTRISTFAIEQAIAKCNIGNAFAFVYEDRGHKIFYLTFPDGGTWGFDVATSKWHRRQSYGLSRWRINTLTAWNGGWYAGDYSNGQIYKLDWTAMQENGLALERRRIGGVLNNQQNPIVVDGFALVLNTGMPYANEAFVDLRYSKDGGNNWSNWRTMSMGETGGFVKRLEFTRFGICRQMVFDMRITDPVRADLLDASINLEGAKA
jgi:hypothetical protein